MTCRLFSAHEIFGAGQSSSCARTDSRRISTAAATISSGGKYSARRNVILSVDDRSRITNELAEVRRQTALIRLSIQMQSDHLDLVIEEPSWREFLETRSRITDEMDDAREQRVATEKAQEEAEVAGLIAQLHKLTDDSRFAKLPTQKAMLQYALRQIPELDSIDPSDLKSEIQEIKAKIDAGP